MLGIELRPLAFELIDHPQAKALHLRGECLFHLLHRGFIPSAGLVFRGEVGLAHGQPFLEEFELGHEADAVARAGADVAGESDPALVGLRFVGKLHVTFPCGLQCGHVLVCDLVTLAVVFVAGGFPAHEGFSEVDRDRDFLVLHAFEDRDPMVIAALG